jgi:hypothetical protein
MIPHPFGWKTAAHIQRLDMMIMRRRQALDCLTTPAAAACCALLSCCCALSCNKWIPSFDVFRQAIDLF